MTERPPAPAAASASGGPSGPARRPAPAPAPAPAAAAFELRWRSAFGWLLYAAFLGILDGLPGTLAALVVGVVYLGRFPKKAIGWLGVACLAAVPVVVVVQGIPNQASVSPKFVSRSLWPHHLTFIGLALVCTAAVIDLVPTLRALRKAGVVHPEATDPLHAEPFRELSLRWRWIIVSLVFIAAAWSCVGVIRA